MHFPNNFIILTSSRMVDPMLKIAIQATRFEFDDNTQGFRIDYDPELRPDGLWQKMPEKEIRLRIAGGMPREENDLIPFKSERNRTLASFSIKEEIAGDRLLLTFMRDEKGYYTMRELIAHAAAGPASDYPDEFIDYVVRAMPNWYCSNFTPSASKRPRLTFLLDGSFARHLPSAAAKPIQGTNDGMVMLVERDLN